jgi:hypothetical protein
VTADESLIDVSAVDVRAQVEFAILIDETHRTGNPGSIGPRFQLSATKWLTV